MLRRNAAALSLLFVLLAGCAGMRDGAPRAPVRDLPGDAVPREEPKSRYGNAPLYEVFGKRYRVMESSRGYSERGVASWYGRKFHGRLTSSREPYDMYAMTAAHKSLPLPTYVRVRNLRNDKSVVVRVNDRGPFVNNRIIDLSYAAALKLDMIESGTSLVEVTAISFDEPAGDRPTRVTSSAPPPAEDAAPVTVQAVPEPGRAPPAVAPADPGLAVENPPERAARTPANELAQNRVFVQVGAFGSRENAERRHTLLLARGIGNAFVYTDLGVTPAIHRVRIGPIVNALQYDVLVEELGILGIMDPYLVTD